MSEPMRGIPFVLSGPSGVGKGTVIQALRDKSPNLALSVSMTTRLPRPGEADGVHYRFVSRERFEEAIAGGELAEWAEVYGQYYGTPKSALEDCFAAGSDAVLDIDVQGAASVRTWYPEAVLIYLLPPSWDALRERLYSRKKGEGDDLELRIERAKLEARYAAIFDYRVVNDTVKAAAARLAAIVEASRLSRAKAELE